MKESRCFAPTRRDPGKTTRVYCLQAQRISHVEFPHFSRGIREYLHLRTIETTNRREQLLLGIFTVFGRAYTIYLDVYNTENLDETSIFIKPRLLLIFLIVPIVSDT